MDILAKALSDILARVASDYRLDHAELVSRYISSSGTPPKPQVAPQTNLCTAKTAKGAPCKYKPQKGSCVCKIHASKATLDELVHPPEPMEEVPKASKKKKTPKKTKAAVPEHTHALTEDLSPDNACQLCDTHGSVLDPGMPEAEFELVDEEPDLAARLKAVLSGEDDLEEDPEDLEEGLAEDEDFEDDQVILARLKAITSSNNSLTVSVADLLS
jgi:hypothetical protein